MARTATTFVALFDEFTQAVRSVAGASVVDAALKATLVRHLNAAYRKTWLFDGTEWEDSWEEGAVSVTDGFIDYADIDDAHVFVFWSADPRANTAAKYIQTGTSKAGIWVGTDWNSGVYGFWRPVCPQWDGSSTSQSIITALKDPTIAFAEAEYYRASGQHQTAAIRRKDAQDLCDELAGIEFSRVQGRWWLRRRDH